MTTRAALVSASESFASMRRSLPFEHSELDRPMDQPTRITSPQPDGACTADDTRPGVLRGGATLTLQSRQAQRLVKGRAAHAGLPAILGLLGFAHLVRLIWHGAQADDPYADWWILKIHEALAATERDLLAQAQILAERMNANSAIAIAPCASVKPTRTQLTFSNPYAFRAARLLGIYDRVVCALLSARHTGIISHEEAERESYIAGKVMRRALQSAIGYRFTGVTRGDVVTATAKAQQAWTAMGEIPVEVLSGERRAMYAPRLRRTSASALSMSIDLCLVSDAPLGNNGSYDGNRLVGG